MTIATKPAFYKILRNIYQGEPARREPLGLTMRFAFWQCWRRLLRRPMSFQTVTGARLILLPGASDSLSGFWYHRMPDFEELAFSLHLLRTEDLFVDVGANQGGWSLTAAGKGARVIAFEPVPVTYERLMANIAANPAPVRNRVRTFRTALGDFSGQAKFTTKFDAGNHRIEDVGSANADSTTVCMERMDQILAEEAPVLIKIDVEGAELSVLRGAGNTLAKPSLLAVILETFRPANFNRPELVAIEALLLGHGFKPTGYDPWTRELHKFTNPSQGSQNTIYVRERATTLSRLRTADAVRVFRKWL